MDMMTSKERVRRAALGEPVDRVPVMFWLNPHMTCRLVAEYRPGTSRAAGSIARFLWRRFVKNGMLNAGEWTRGLPLLLEDYGNQQYVLDLGADIALATGDFTSPSTFAKTLRKRDGRLTFRGNFGVGFALGGIYADPIKPVVQQASELSGIEMPSVRPDQFKSIRTFREKHPDTCILAEVTSFNQFLMGFIMKMETYMLSLYDNRESIKSFLGRLAEWVAQIIRYSIQAGADMVYLQDDYGTNGRPLISMNMWQELVYPHLEHLIAVAHEAGAPFVLHSCGYQMTFLDHYVAAELDVLQSFQPMAGNDFEEAYTRYGDRLTFATGIDIQRGEGMSPQELRDEIIRVCRIGRRKNRHILATTHMMQYTMPMDNVRAIFDTVAEIKAGLHD